MMLSPASSFFLLLLIFPKFPINTVAAAATPAYTATDFILLNCGASSNLKDFSKRTWNGDKPSRYSPWNAAIISSAFKASRMDSSVFKVPYQTARIFGSSFRYTFPVLTGPKFLRLYFYPTIYSDFNTSQSFFSVTANAFTLLSNFSALLYFQNSFMKEFVINIEESNQRLDLTFSPNPNSFAFVNGIEIVSIPDKLYFRGNDVPVKFVDKFIYLNSNTALENLYRLNVGGDMVQIQNDSGLTRGMFRAWSPDFDYLLDKDVSSELQAETHQFNYTAETPSYSAPEIVYTTSRVIDYSNSSLDWGFLVDSGFYYLLRLHFCEFTLKVTEQNQRVFTISIQRQTAEIQADVIRFAGGPGIPIFRDYITWIPDNGHRGKQFLRLSLIPNLGGHPKYGSALLNGLEIFKLNDSYGSLAAPDLESAIISSPPAAAVKPIRKKKNGGFSLIFPIIGGVIGILAVVSAVSFLIFRRQQKVKDLVTTSPSWVLLSIPSRLRKRTSGPRVSLPSDLCRYFSLDEIKKATCNFSDNVVIGKGGFGYVYKGLINDGATTVAIKRLNPLANQGAREFLTEIEMLSMLSHRNLVSLIGYCNKYGEMILVYDYVAHGTLRSHLYNPENSPLTWKQRLQICIGAAKGLDYIHTGAKHTIIHRDVKSTNILLDEKWVAKIGDFGLSKVGPLGGAHTHVSTAVKGSFGYVDPEYHRRQQLTDKSDVYSFGVVLVEVLCARPPLIPSLPREQANLADWAELCFEQGTIEQIIDSNLKGQIAPECLTEFVETAVACLSDKGTERPAMRGTVRRLEFAMQLQEVAESRGLSVPDGDGDSFFASKVGLKLSTSQDA